MLCFTSTGRRATISGVMTRCLRGGRAVSSCCCGGLAAAAVPGCGEARASFAARAYCCAFDNDFKLNLPFTPGCLCCAAIDIATPSRCCC